MYAIRWKKKLLKEYKVHFLPISLSTNEDVIKDLDRTFPNNEWFQKYKVEITNIILNFIDMNPAFSYMQGMCFMVFTLFYVFRHSDYRDCETLYALHKLIEPSRPVYPLHKTDENPLKFIESTTKIILLMIHVESKQLSQRLKKHNLGVGAKSTRGLKWKIIYKKKFYDKRLAMSFEYRLKKDKKKRKYLLNIS